ncbi:hypothetical protein RJ639_008653 [Escallonia herrerae]|uniref:DUF1995 domain-containing protein n=1 Tax=Escallonia herrerae TaxID=1293975 RepID=A0AA88VS89_9ASTE|nr:hypothetical protein RJ639_008653 [Escallonia herrerae]
MPLSPAQTAFGAPVAIPSPLNPKVVRLGSFQVKKGMNLYQRKILRDVKFVTNSLSGGTGASVKYDVPFPSDYSELLEQAKEATALALQDKRQLMVGLYLCFSLTLIFENGSDTKVSMELTDKFLLQEIEFPTAGLESVPGDGEGGIEMTGSIQLIREFCDLLVSREKATRTRIFFPEANEVGFARESVFGGASYKLDYLTKPSFFEDFGFVTKVKMADRVKSEDELFLVGYPYFNVNDYPPFFYPKLGALTKTLFPKMETVYYIHNFKGRNGGALFRCYPGPWKVLKKARNKYVCVHQQEVMPSLKEVALDILPSA